MRSSLMSSVFMKDSQRKSELTPAEVVPFGRYGAGVWTSHPVGLVGVFGVLLIGLIALPEARVFIGGAIGLGILFGFILWLVHR